MVSRNLKRIMMLIITAVLIIQVCQCQIVDVAWKRFRKDIIQKQKEYKTEVSEAEIIDFIRLWPEFKQLQLEDKADASYQVEDDAQQLNFKTKIWFLYHKWEAERFFYVRQRIEHLLQSIEVKKKAEAIINDLSQREDEIAKDMINLQQKRLEAEILSEEETALIIKYRGLLQDILKN